MTLSSLLQVLLAVNTIVCSLLALSVALVDNFVSIWLLFVLCFHTINFKGEASSCQSALGSLFSLLRICLTPG
jgi:hypothetical protein